MKPEIKYSFSFEGIDSRIAVILESKLSGIVSQALQEIENRVETLNTLAEQGLLEHVDVTGILNAPAEATNPGDLDEPTAASKKVSKPAKKKSKKASAKKVVFEASSSSDDSNTSGDGSIKAAAPESDSNYTKAPNGRIVRKAGAPGAMPVDFIENIRFFMRKGDDDATLMREHNATKGLLSRLRAEEGGEAPKGESPKSIENQAVGLLNGGKNVVSVATELGISLPEINRIARKHGFK
jgi:hypothetical protein